MDVALDVQVDERPLRVPDVVRRVAVVADLLQVQLPFNISSRRYLAVSSATGK